MELSSKSSYDAWVDWTDAYDWTVCGTLNFAPHKKRYGDEAQRLWRRFWNKADRLVYGNSSKHGLRIERAVFKHYGADGENPHIHFLAKPPIDPVEFCVTLNALWRATTDCAAHPISNEILPLICKHDASEYMLHEHWKLDSRTFNGELSHMNFEHKLPHLKNNDIMAHTQAHDRLIKATHGTWLTRARLAFAAHLASAPARYRRRHSELWQLMLRLVSDSSC